MTAGMINFLKENINLIKFPLINVEGKIGFHTVNRLYLDKYNKLYVNYSPFGSSNIRALVGELNEFFVSNIYKKVLNQISEDLWDD